MNKITFASSKKKNKYYDANLVREQSKIHESIGER